jgi:hypothetical protein
MIGALVLGALLLGAANGLVRFLLFVREGRSNA